jgi:pimeloyl-ACP methyl ester carboxylesterase
MGSRGLSRVFAVAGLAVAAALVNRGLARRAERRTPPTGRFVEAHGVRLHWIERGSGPTLIALHGDGSLLQEVAISGLVDRLGNDFRVIVLDRPGYGYSERPGRGWTPRAQADLIAAFMDQLGVAEAVILGHSWGTLVALALAVDHPHRVTRLVLMSGYFYPVPRLDAALLSPAALPVIGDILRWTVAPALTRLALPFLVANCFAPLPVPERFHRAFPKGLALRPSHLRAAAEDTAHLQSGAADLSRTPRCAARSPSFRGAPIRWWMSTTTPGGCIARSRAANSWWSPVSATWSTIPPWNKLSRRSERARHRRSIDERRGSFRGAVHGARTRVRSCVVNGF